MGEAFFKLVYFVYKMSDGVQNAAFAAGMPAWDTKPRYDPGVLVGNWYEERKKYHKANLDHTSSYRTDYNPYGGASPDFLVRRNAVHRGDGMGHKHLFGHHGKAYDKSLITWYDQDYNGRGLKRPPSQGLPDLREWKVGTQMAWIPEKTDFPTTTKHFFGKVPEQTRVDRFYIGKSLNKQKSTVLPLSTKTLDALSAVS